MTLWRSRRTNQRIVIALLAAAICWVVPLVPAAIPLADGPRVLRQYAVAFLPCLLAPLLVDPYGVFSDSLTRSRGILLRDRAVCLAICWGTLGPSWFISRIGADEFLFEAATLAALMGFVLVGTRRWGSPAVLAAALTGCVWLLAGNTLAEALGFGSFGIGWHPGVTPVAVTFAALAFAVQVISLVSGLSLTGRSAGRPLPSSQVRVP